MTLALLSLLAPLASADQVTYQNDGFVDGDQVGFQGGFITNECWAVTYVPSEDDYPFTLDTLQLLVGGNSAQERFIFEIWEADQLSNRPTTRRIAEAVYIQGSSSYMTEIYIADFKFSTEDVTFEWGNVAIALCLDDHSGYPAIARDVDGMAYADRNWIYDSGRNWYQSSAYGLSGDWIQRLVIETDGGSVVLDSGDTGSVDSGEEEVDSGGGGGSGDDTSAEEEPADTLTLLQITPSEAAEGESVDVVLLGTGFTSDAEARIGGVTITGQEVRNAETISGRSPSSLPVGSHDVEILLGNGDNAYLPGAFTVTEAEAEADVDEGGCSSSATRAPAALASLFALGLVGLRRRR